MSKLYLKDGDEYKCAFIVVSLGYWGRGDTLHDAAQNCLRSGARRTDDCYVQLVIGDDKPEISSGGMMVRESGSDVLRIGNLFKLSALLKQQRKGE